jgi:hypothetical protein
MTTKLYTDLKEILESNADGVSFLPINPKLEIRLNGFVFKTKSKSGSYVKGNLGHYYHILLYKPSKKGAVTEVDLFDAILTDPSVYIMNLIRSGFFGVVAKKTKTSNKFMKNLRELVLKGASL